MAVTFEIRPHEAVASTLGALSQVISLGAVEGFRGPKVLAASDHGPPALVGMFERGCSEARRRLWE